MLVIAETKYLKECPRHWEHWCYWGTVDYVELMLMRFLAASQEQRCSLSLHFFKHLCSLCGRRLICNIISSLPVAPVAEAL